MIIYFNVSLICAKKISMDCVEENNKLQFVFYANTKQQKDQNALYNTKIIVHVPNDVGTQ